MFNCLYNPPALGIGIAEAALKNIFFTARYMSVVIVADPTTADTEATIIVWVGVNKEDDETVEFVLLLKIVGE